MNDFIIRKIMSYKNQYQSLPIQNHYSFFSLFTFSLHLDTAQNQHPQDKAKQSYSLSSLYIFLQNLLLHPRISPKERSSPETNSKPVYQHDLSFKRVSPKVRESEPRRKRVISWRSRLDEANWRKCGCLLLLGKVVEGEGLRES